MDLQADLAALRREKLNQQLPVQQWNAAANLLPASTNPAATQSTFARSSRKAFSLEKGASRLRSPVAYRSAIVKSSLADDYPLQSPARAFADNKGATALMLVFGPMGAAADLDGERELLEAVQIAPDALSTLAEERARNVKTYLVETGKVEPQRITESPRGGGSNGSRGYLRLQ